MSRIEQLSIYDRWIKRDDGALCMDGYPIRIERGNDLPFRVVSEWHKFSCECGSLGYAKSEAKRLAMEIHEFNNPATSIS